MTLNRRDFLHRLALLVPAAALMSRVKSVGPDPVLMNEEALHPMRYLRSIQRFNGDGTFHTWTETSDSPRGPWVKLADNEDGTLQAFYYPPLTF